MLSQIIETFLNMIAVDPIVVEMMNGSAAVAAVANHQRSRPKRGAVVVAAAPSVSSNRPQTRSVVAAAAAAAAAAPVSIETAAPSVRPRTRAAVAAAKAALAAASILSNRPRTRAAVAAAAAAADAALSLSAAAEKQSRRPTRAAARAKPPRRKNAKKTLKKKTMSKKTSPKTKTPPPPQEEATPPPQPLRSVLRKSNFSKPRVNLKFVERGDTNAERLGDWESALETCPSFPSDDRETQRLVEKNGKWRIKMMEDHPESSSDVMDVMDVFTFRHNLARHLLKDAADLEESDLLLNEIGELESYCTYERDEKVEEWADQMAEFEAGVGKGKKVQKKRVQFED